MQVCSFCVSSFYWFVLELVLWARAVHLHIALILWGRFSQFSCSEITCKPFSWLLLSCCQTTIPGYMIHCLCMTRSTCFGTPFSCKTEGCYA